MKNIEEQMEELFMEMIDNRFVDHVYSGNRSVVTKEEFVNAIAGKESLIGAIDLTKKFRSRKQQPEEKYNIKKGPIRWLFSPRYLRQVFEKQGDGDENDGDDNDEDEDVLQNQGDQKASAK